MTAEPLISVIIPTYNQESFLAQAVESVFAQSYPHIQAIVINDGSTDSTEKVAHKLQEKFPKLEYVYQQNAGVIVACGKAFQQVKGDYFLRLDGDDYLPTNYVQELYDALVKEPNDIAFAYCDAQYVGAREGRIMALPYSMKRLLYENYIHVSALIRTSVVRKTGYFNPVMRYGLEDWDLWLTLAENGFKGVYCKGTMLYYRQHTQASRNAMTEERHREMFQQIIKNHPAVYQKVANRLHMTGWRMKRRIMQYFG